MSTYVQRPPHVSGCQLTLARTLSSACCSVLHLVLAGPPLKVGERVVRLTALTKAPIEAMLTALNLGVQNSIDPEPENLVAVGTFTHTPTGLQPQQVCGRHNASALIVRMTQRHAF